MEATLQKHRLLKRFRYFRRFSFVKKHETYDDKTNETALSLYTQPETINKLIEKKKEKKLQKRKKLAKKILHRARNRRFAVVIYLRFIKTLLATSAATIMSRFIFQKIKPPL